MNKFRTISPIAAALCVCFLSMPGQASADVITDALGGMPANSWRKLNINTFQSVWTPLAQRPTPHLPASNISAWSGAAWDDLRSNLYIWGGDDSYVGDEGNRSISSMAAPAGGSAARCRAGSLQPVESSIPLMA